VDVYITAPNMKGGSKRLRSTVELLRFMCEFPSTPIEPRVVNFEKMFCPVPDLQRGSSSRLLAGLETLYAQIKNGTKVKKSHGHLHSTVYLLLQINEQEVLQVRGDKRGRGFTTSKGLLKLPSGPKRIHKRPLKRPVKEDAREEVIAFEPRHVAYLKRQFEKVQRPTDKQITYLARQIGVEFMRVDDWFREALREYLTRPARKVCKFDISELEMPPLNDDSVPESDNLSTIRCQIVCNNPELESEIDWELHENKESQDWEVLFFDEEKEEEKKETEKR